MLALICVQIWGFIGIEMGQDSDRYLVAALTLPILAELYLLGREAGSCTPPLAILFGMLLVIAMAGKKMRT